MGLWLAFLWESAVDDKGEALAVCVGVGENASCDFSGWDSVIWVDESELLQV